MKILFFTRSFYPQIGGVERHIYEISKILQKKGHQITIIAEQVDIKLEAFEIFEGIDVYRIPNTHIEKLKKFTIWWFLWKNRELIINADIIHAHDVYFWYYPFRFLFFNKPSFITFHGYETHFPIQNKAVIVRKINEILSNGNICIGEFIKKWYGTSPTYLSYGGVNAIIFKNKYTKGLKLLFVGRLSVDTGFKMYYDLVNKLKCRYHKLDFTILGDGSLSNIIKNVGVWKGSVNNIGSYIIKSNIVLSSSYLSILEALIAKRLVFAVYDNPVKEDYLRMTPFAKYIVIAGSAEELYEKVIYYLDHPSEEVKLVEAGYKWARTQTWEKVANLYLKLWKK